jgi:TANFOR domain-containing protein
MKFQKPDLLILTFLVLFVQHVFAQTYPVKVVITVTPPYPVSISYYADHPEQVLVQIINLGREPQSFRLVGSINGLDNNVKVVAKDRGASGVITLNGNEARLLTASEIQELFDSRKLVFTGINYRQTQIDDGLPEGLYNVCAYAVDAVQSNMLRSEQACSNAFQHTNLEPPMIISPMPNAEIPEMPVQNTLFTWTLPASAPPNTEYTIRMVEVVPGMNINQAIQSATTPTFFERTVQGNTLLYGPADPPLVPGRRYAFVVGARDPMQRAVFRNNGRSEVHSFVYAPNSAQPISNNTPAKVITSVTNKDLGKVNVKDLSNLTTSVTGRLVYAFPEDYAINEFEAASNTNPMLEKFKPVTLKSSNFNLYAQQRAGTNHKQVLGYVLSNAVETKPMQHVRVSLVKTYAFSGTANSFLGHSYHIGAGWRIVTAFTNSMSDELDHYMNGKKINDDPLDVLDTQFTGSNGEFTFSFPLKDTCKQFTYQAQTAQSGSKYLSPLTMHKVCVVVVESPYFCSPFMMIYAQPGDNIALPDQISLVKSFQNKFYTLNNLEGDQAGGKRGSLQGITLEIFRIKPNATEMPKEEGTNLPPSAIASLHMGEYSNVYSSSAIERVLAIDKTGSDGSLTIPRLIKRGFNDGGIVVHAFTANTGGYNKSDKLSGALSLGYTYSSSSGTGEFQTTQYFNDFNNAYQYNRYVTIIEMPSKKPRILGKVVELTKGLSGVNVFLIPRSGKNLTLKTITTDKDGMFKFNDVEPANYILSFHKDGYKQKRFGVSDAKADDAGLFNLGDEGAFSLQMGQLLQTNEIQLMPMGLLSGLIKDEDGNDVVCDVQVDDGAFYKTAEPFGYFIIPAAAGMARTLKIFPRSDEYMEETYKINVKDEGLTSIKAGALVVYRNRHRIKFAVWGKVANSQSVMGQVAISVNGITEKTNGQGEAIFEFESPGDKFLVSVKPPKNSGYQHWEEEISIPVSKTPIDYKVLLRYGSVINVAVNEEVDGKIQPSKNAKVYIKQLNNAWNDNPTNYTEAFTNVKGICQLKGIPDNETNVEVFVTKSPDGLSSYTASSQTINFNKGQQEVSMTFKLVQTKAFAVNHIWGYPVQIEKIKALGNDTYQVSGSFTDLPGNENFRVLNSETRLDFKDVVFVKNPTPNSTSIAQAKPSSQNTPYGNVQELQVKWYDSHMPKNDFVLTLHNAVGIRIYKKLQGKALGYGGGYNNVSRLAISKAKSNYAVLKANVKLDLASFKGAYQLKGDINLGSTKNSPVVDVFNSNHYPQRKFFVGQGSDNGGNNTFHFENLPYTVHNFTAEADIERSYVSNDSVNLFTILHTAIPSLTPSDLNIQAGYITILPNQILPFEGGNDITFSMEKWKVIGQKPKSSQQTTVYIDGKKSTVTTAIEGNAWTYDKNNGGIIIPKVVVNTGIIGVTLANLIIKPDRLIADKLELDKKDAAALSLGGIVPLTILPETQLYFTYDPNCYHDNKPHWKLSLLNPKGKAAEVKNLDGLDDGQIIPFESMNIFSDNQQQLSGGASNNLVFKKVLNFAPVTVDVGSDYFTLLGSASFDIPNISNGGKKISGQIVYTKGSNGKAIFNYKPLYFDVEGAGKVTFQATDQASTQSLTTGKFTAEGLVKIYDDGSKQSFLVKGSLFHQKTKNGSDTYIEIANKQKFPLGAKYFDINPGIANSGMRVKDGNWDFMRIKTTLPTGDNGFEMIKSEEQYRSLSLVVNGAITTDPSSGMIGMKGMDTGMGSISMFYDFKRNEFRGNFFFNPPVPLHVGLFNITSGNVSMAAGENGIFVMNNGTGDVALPGGLPLPVTTTATSVTGYYTQALPQEDLNTIIDLSVHKTLPDFMTYGIKGIFSSATAKISPLDKDYDMTGDVGIPGWVSNVSAYAKAELDYEVRNYVNFKSSDNFDLFLGFYGYGEVNIGGEATILGCGPEADVKFIAQLAATQSASPSVGLSYGAIKSTISSLSIGGCGSLTGSLYLGACFLRKCLGFHLDKTISLHFKSSLNDPFDIWYTLDDCGNDPQVSKLNSSGY